MAANERTANGRMQVAALALLVLAALPATAQVSSQGRGSMTFALGRGAGPLGSVATNVVAGANVAPDRTLRSSAFRVGGGYQFADYVGAEVALVHIGTLRSRARYGSTDTLVAETQFNAVEVDLVGRIPLAEDFRVDLSAGAAVSGLRTTLTTVQGSTLPPQPGALNARRVGPAAGADLEWRLGDSASLIVGYHLYSHVGSARIVGLASGTMTLLAAGLRIEF